MRGWRVELSFNADGDEPVPKEAGVEVYNAQGTPVIQMTDAALLDNDYLTPQRVMADPV